MIDFPTVKDVRHEKFAPRKVVVAVRLDHAPGRARLEGILRHLRHGRNWQVTLVENEPFTSETVARTLADGVDGFLVFRALDADAWRQILASGVPAVSLESVFTPPGLAKRRSLRLLRNDDEGIGALAARHLLTLGNFRAFAFVPAPGRTHWSARREAGFVAALAAAGRACTVIPQTADGESENDAALADGIARLPRPFALFAATDFIALRALTACRAAKIGVPQSAAILGADDDELICTHAVPRLTSIRFVTERQGELVTRELERLMDGQTAGPSILPWTYHEIVRRESTAPIAPAARLIACARDLIDRQATRGIRVADVARELGVSRQLLDLRFRQFEHESVAAAISARRFAELTRRLAETDAPIARLARACGFHDLANLTRHFRARYGMTMREWRLKKKSD